MEEFDLVIEGGVVVDGTGAPRREASVGVKDGRIVAIEDHIDGPRAETIDAGGRVVAPGFIDSHTHLESQFFWDTDALPATWHGCTTVIMGNCGLSLAPISPEGPDFAAGLMSAVEQIPRSILDEVVPFNWRTFGGYIDAVEQHGLGPNAASFVGYSNVRHSVMGERAFGGEATEDDMVAIEELLREALSSGALGISFNQCTYDRDPEGRLMAGYDADWDEMRRAASVILEFPGTMLQVIPSWSEMSAGWNDRNEEELERWTEILIDLDRPMVWSAVSERDFEAQMAATRKARAAGADMTAGIHSIPIYTFATFAAPSLFDAAHGTAFLFELSMEDRLAALRDPAVRERIRSEMGTETFTAAPVISVAEDGTESMGDVRTFRWDQIFHVGSPPSSFQLAGSVADVARERGVHPVDVVLDAAVESELADVFVVFVYGLLPEVTEKLLLDPDTVIASNDTGAHLMLMAQTQATQLFDQWSRESGVLTLEQAVNLLTGRQARVFGLSDRGTLEVGKAADIVIFDADEIGPQAPELVDDLPGAGGTRYIARARGIQRVIVNGVTLLVDGEPVGTTPGRFIRQRQMVSST